MSNKINNLTALPNIGKTLAKKLLLVGIDSPEKLRAIGSQGAFLQLGSIDESACYNMLCALEGAIQNIRWHNLNPEKKQELKEFLKLKKSLPSKTYLK